MMTNEEKILELKRQLSEELQKEESDNNLIISLSNKISNLDERTVRFSVDAGIINRLGKELVGRHETAVSELVKNAYDADATTVDLYFENTTKKGGRLTIVDNGTGMSREQLVYGFMKISSSDKIHNPQSPRYKRTRAGQKGIGRFATQRLGDILNIVTQTKDSQDALRVVINWKDYGIDQDINLVSNKIEKVSKEREEGTTLIIDNLRDAWTEGMIRRSFRYISELLQPFPLSEKTLKNTEDPGFKASFHEGSIENNVPVIDEDSGFFQHALAEIEGYVDNSGDGFYNIKSTKIEIDENEIYAIGKNKRNDEYKSFNSLKNIHFKSYYYIYSSNLIPKQIETYIRNNAREYGGIRLYRNGFRVLPYAEMDNDWLGLDASVRRRSYLQPHSNINFFGFVEIFDIEGNIFQELSSREGLIENEAFLELKDFAYKVLTDATQKINHLRKVKTTTGQKDWIPKKPKEILDEVAANLEKVAEKKSVDKTKSIEDGESYETESELSPEDFLEFAQKIKDASEQQDIETKALLQEIQLLRILANLGLIIGEFIHEIKHHLDAFRLDINALIHDRSDEVDVLNKLERLSLNSDSFKTYTAYFDKAISENVNRELEPIEIRDVIKPFYKVVAPNCVRAGITLVQHSFKGYDLFTCPMHKSEWASILFNLFSNSKKAIKRAGVKGEIFIEAGKVNDYIYMDFSDNGDGIPEENIEKIFDPFFTTSSPSGKDADEIEEMTGTGLGLKIVKDIVSGYNGDIIVKEPKNGFSTTIRVTVPINK